MNEVIKANCENCTFKLSILVSYEKGFDHAVRDAVKKSQLHSQENPSHSVSVTIKDFQ